MCIIIQWKILIKKLGFIFSIIIIIYTKPLVFTLKIYISCIDDNLKVNLDNLLIQLRAQVSPLWYQFGEAAGVETEMLEKLANDCSPQDCIVEMFDCWLRKQKEPPTWRDVAKILKVIKLEQIAAKIEEVYTTGNTMILIISNLL